MNEHDVRRFAAKTVDLISDILLTSLRDPETVIIQREKPRLTSLRKKALSVTRNARLKEKRNELLK